MTFSKSNQQSLVVPEYSQQHRYPIPINFSFFFFSIWQSKTKPIREEDYGHKRESIKCFFVCVFMLLFLCEPAPFPVDDLCQLSALHSSTAFPSSDLWENVLWPVIDSALPAPLLSIAVKVPVICRKPVSTAPSPLSLPLSAAHTMCFGIAVTSSLHPVLTHRFSFPSSCFHDVKDFSIFYFSCMILNTL